MNLIILWPSPSYFLSPWAAMPSFGDLVKAFREKLITLRIVYPVGWCCIFLFELGKAGAKLLIEPVTDFPMQGFDLPCGRFVKFEFCQGRSPLTVENSIPKVSKWTTLNRGKGPYILMNRRENLGDTYLFIVGVRRGSSLLISPSWTLLRRAIHRHSFI